MMYVDILAYPVQNYDVFGARGVKTRLFREKYHLPGYFLDRSGRILKWFAFNF